MPSFTLADIQAAADKKYGPMVIDLGDSKVELVNPIRMSKDKRDKLTALDTEEDVDKKLAAIVRLACSQRDAKALLDAVGSDLGALAEIVTEWSKSSQVGEA